MSYTNSVFFIIGKTIAKGKLLFYYESKVGSMDAGEVLKVAHIAVWTVLKLAMPIMLVGMAVGLVIALFQAMTQIQEMTLAFVPKILAIFLSLLVLGPSMGPIFTELSDYIFSAIIHLNSSS